MRGGWGCEWEPAGGGQQPRVLPCWSAAPVPAPCMCARGAGVGAASAVDLYDENKETIVKLKEREDKLNQWAASFQEQQGRADEDATEMMKEWDKVDQYKKELKEKELLLNMQHAKLLKNQHYPDEQPEEQLEEQQEEQPEQQQQHQQHHSTMSTLKTLPRTFTNVCVV